MNAGGADRGRTELPESPPDKKARTRRAQQVVDNARRRNKEQGNVHDLPSTRLERGANCDKPTLTAIYAKTGGGEPDRIDLSFLIDFPGLTDAFAEGCLKWLKPLVPLSRIVGVRNLKGYWFAYLAEKGLSEVLLSQLDEQIMAGFKTWLHQQRTAEGKPLSPNTIRKAFSPLRSVLGAAPGSSRWLELVPAGPRGAQSKAVPTEVLQLDELLMVMAAVEKEVLALRDRWESGRRLLAQGRQYRQEGRALHPNPRNVGAAQAEANVALCLALLDQRYPGVIPDQRVITADDPLLGATVQLALGMTKVTGYFYPSARDLVPLVLSIALATVFNPFTVLKLEWKNIDREVDRLSNGRPAVRIDVTEEDEPKEAAETSSPLAKLTGDKRRAKRQLVRLLDPEASGPNQVSLNLVLDLLTEITARIRPHVVDSDAYADRAFLYVQKSLQKRPKGFGDSSLVASDITWQWGLGKFIADNKLPAFTLKTIRATLIDYVQLFNRGDLEAARQVGNHSRGVITWTHYTSNFVKRLLQEATGETLLVRERWLQSNGKLDPRKFRDWTDKGCATPGFVCLDPFDSPRPNQKKGRLCNAYGECPDCPVAAARPNNSRNIMLYEALRRAIYRSVTRVTPPVWQQRWAPVVAALDGLLERIPAHILEESRTLSVELPDIG